jgi:hypothetical protein
MMVAEECLLGERYIESPEMAKKFFACLPMTILT